MSETELTEADVLARLVREWSDQAHALDKKLFAVSQELAAARAELAQHAALVADTGRELTTWDLNKMWYWTMQGVSPTPTDTRTLIYALQESRARLTAIVVTARDALPLFREALEVASEAWPDSEWADTFEAYDALEAAALAVQPAESEANE